MSEVKSVVIERTLKAPISKVWSMWTVGDNFSKWYGPEGAEITVATMDAKQGGKRHVSMNMTTPNGPMTMWYVGEHTEVTPETKLVYTESMSNEKGDVLDPATMGMPDHPKVTTVTVELTEMGDSTKMVVTHAGVPAGSPGEMGWNMAIDKLEKQL